MSTTWCTQLSLRHLISELSFPPAWLIVTQVKIEPHKKIELNKKKVPVREKQLAQPPPRFSAWSQTLCLCYKKALIGNHALDASNLVLSYAWWNHFLKQHPQEKDYKSFHLEITFFYSGFILLQGWNNIIDLEFLYN